MLKQRTSRVQFGEISTLNHSEVHQKIYVPGEGGKGLGNGQCFSTHTPAPFDSLPGVKLFPAGARA